VEQQPEKLKGKCANLNEQEIEELKVDSLLNYRQISDRGNKCLPKRKIRASLGWAAEHSSIPKALN
jgi:hypothetical protein